MCQCFTSKSLGVLHSALSTQLSPFTYIKSCQDLYTFFDQSAIYHISFNLGGSSKCQTLLLGHHIELIQPDRWEVSQYIQIGRFLICAKGGHSVYLWKKWGRDCVSCKSSVTLFAWFNPLCTCKIFEIQPSYLSWRETLLYGKRSMKSIWSICASASWLTLMLIISETVCTVMLLCLLSWGFKLTALLAVSIIHLSFLCLAQHYQVQIRLSMLLIKPAKPVPTTCIWLMVHCHLLWLLLHDLYFYL